MDVVEVQSTMLDDLVLRQSVLQITIFRELRIYLGELDTSSCDALVMLI